MRLGGGGLSASLRSRGPQVSLVTRAATRPIAAYPLKSSAGPTQPKPSKSSVVMNGVKPDTMAEIWYASEAPDARVLAVNSSGNHAPWAPASAFWQTQ